MTEEWERWNTQWSTTVEQEVFGQTLRLAQDPNSNHLGTTVWDSSIVLAKYLEKNSKKGEFSRPKLKGKKCVELGSGMGLGGLAFAMLGADTVLTEQAAVLPLLQSNYERNLHPSTLRANHSAWHGMVGKVHVAELDWVDRSHPEKLPVKAPFDFVLAADCVYHEHIIEDLLRTTVALVHPKSTVIVVNELRSQAVQDRFESIFGEVFTIKKIARSRMDPAFQHDAIYIFHLKMRKDMDEEKIAAALKTHCSSTRAATQDQARRAVEGDMVDYATDAPETADKNSASGRDASTTPADATSIVAASAEAVSRATTSADAASADTTSGSAQAPLPEGELHLKATCSARAKDTVTTGVQNINLSDAEVGGKPEASGGTHESHDAHTGKQAEQFQNRRSGVAAAHLLADVQVPEAVK